MRGAKALQDLLNQRELFKDVPYSNNLVIDSTRLSAKKTAKIIADHYGLP